MKSVVFVGQAYYNAYFLNLELRKKGYDSLLINIDPSLENRKKYYWGEDLFLPVDVFSKFEVYLACVHRYDFFHFANRGGIYFLGIPRPKPNTLLNLLGVFFLHILTASIRISQLIRPGLLFYLMEKMSIISIVDGQVRIKAPKSKVEKVLKLFSNILPANWDIYLLKAFGKKIIYSNNGCHDGVGPSEFVKWGPYNVCEICPNFNTPSCTDEGSREWGKFRNKVSDFQILFGSNRAEFNIGHTLHEVPEYYCLDEDLWVPELEIPEKYKLNIPDDVVKIYHSVGNYESRTKNGINIKSSHIYFPLIEELKKEGFKVELVFCKDIPNTDVRYIMAQCDIVADMLTFGWYGANIREALMLGIPSICFLRQEWLDDVHKEIPGYVEDMPVINANPETIKQELIKLVSDPELRKAIGKKSRDFALKYHSKKAGVARMEKIYKSLS